MATGFAIAMTVCLAAGAAEPPARVVVVATYHFSNPARDLNNVAVVDVLAPEHRRALLLITEALAKFEPTFVGVEWPALLP